MLKSADKEHQSVTIFHRFKNLYTKPEDIKMIKAKDLAQWYKRLPGKRKVVVQSPVPKVK